MERDHASTMAQLQLAECPSAVVALTSTILVSQSVPTRTLECISGSVGQEASYASPKAAVRNEALDLNKASDPSAARDFMSLHKRSASREFKG